MSITSPCIKACKIDDVSGLCFGCARSLDEIGRWGAMEEAERIEICGRLEDRRAEHFALSPAQAHSEG